MPGIDKSYDAARTDQLKDFTQHLEDIDKYTEKREVRGLLESKLAVLKDQHSVCFDKSTPRSGSETLDNEASYIRTVLEVALLKDKLGQPGLNSTEDEAYSLAKDVNTINLLAKFFAITSEPWKGTVESTTNSDKYMQAALCMKCTALLIRDIHQGDEVIKLLENDGFVTMFRYLQAGFEPKPENILRPNWRRGNAHLEAAKNILAGKTLKLQVGS